jgi:uncharacterized membrane protein
VDPSGIVDALLPGPGGRLDRASTASQGALQALTSSPAGRPVWRALHGNDWSGHPLHPVIIPVPIGAWTVSAWYDARSARTGDERDEHAADGALRVGLAGAAVAAATGLAQYVDTRGAVRRETAVHAALNNVALGLYVASDLARRRGRRPLGRRLAAAGLAVVAASGYLGGDISYRHGVGVRPQAIRDPGREPQQTPDQPLETAGARHL